MFNKVCVANPIVSCVFVFAYGYGTLCIGLCVLHVVGAFSFVVSHIFVLLENGSEFEAVNVFVGFSKVHLKHYM